MESVRIGGYHSAIYDVQPEPWPWILVGTVWVMGAHSRIWAGPYPQWLPQHFSICTDGRPI